MDLASYRAEAEQFASALDREYYLHFSGQSDEYDIEPIYARHSGLFARAAVEVLREVGERTLLEFAVHGHVERETKTETAELARREAALEVEVDAELLPFRAASVMQANEPQPERRAAIEAARNAAVEEHLNPLLREMLERSHALAKDLGWSSMRAMCAELSNIDLAALGRQAEALLDATEDGYEAAVGPELERQLGFGFGRLVRADVPAFFRAPTLDRHFAAERLVPSLAETLAGMGIRFEDQPGVTVDVEQRPKKSPRAFCAPVRVPDEIYLVIATIGGRDDYAALFHEAGHTEHYAHVDRALPVEHRLFGDNSVTEAFAFLLEHLVSHPEWLRRRLSVEAAEEVVRHARATNLLLLRRYCANLGYELVLHDAAAALDGKAELYARRLSRAVHVDWPHATWLSDVDPFFYAARYLRAWALETHLRRELVGRFGEAWFEEPGAGEMLRGLWRQGQRLGAEELLGALEGDGATASHPPRASLDLSVLVEGARR